MEEEGAEDQQDRDGLDGDGDNVEGDEDVTKADGDGFIDRDGNLYKGSLKVDATCCDVEVKYPTDLDVLNDARDVSERLIDTLCKLSGSPKPRTHRKQARRHFLQVAKMKRKPKSLIRKGIRQQLGYLGRNIQNIIGIISSNSTSLFDMLPKREKQWIGTAIKVYHQQKGMYESNTHKCPDRIVSVFQPHVRPIVRGKSKAKVEFVSKIGVSVVDGYTFIDHFSWDAYNESVDLKQHHIKAAGKPLGRPTKEMQTEAYKAQSAKDMGERNEVESTFGTGKRVYRANDVRAKLPDTADAWTAACFMVKNVMKFLRGLLFVLLKMVKMIHNKARLLINIQISYPLRVVT